MLHIDYSPDNNYKRTVCRVEHSFECNEGPGSELKGIEGSQFCIDCQHLEIFMGCTLH